jgi:(2R)-sulfolactate sulfo-lyase subunit alpha
VSHFDKRAKKGLQEKREASTIVVRGNTTYLLPKLINGRVYTMHKFLIHHKGDHVGVAVTDIEAGETVIGVNMDDESQVEVVSKHNVPLGHKIAIVDLDNGAGVVKYGIQIGYSTQTIKVGDYVHTHNIKTARW